MNSTQVHIGIADVKEGLVLLKNGNFALILKVGAVNFGLLSEQEQIGIIASFAQMLNSLSFAIQISIISKRLDISAYLKLLDLSLNLQTNQLLTKMMQNYRQFVQSLIKERDVLDKTFYIVLPLSGFELGLKPGKDLAFKKAKIILEPRRDQIIRQLARVGLKSNQLTNQELVKLFYEIYNGAQQPTVVSRQSSEKVAPNIPIMPVLPVPMRGGGERGAPMSARNEVRTEVARQLSRQDPEQRRPRNHPFVVEELQ